jgi:DNA-binding NarL/FixJ family response regulator
MNAKLKILVVDDHPIFLKGLVEVLQDEMPEAEIVSQKSSLKALSIALSQMPDIAVLDLDMPDMNGIALSKNHYFDHAQRTRYHSLRDGKRD